MSSLQLATSVGDVRREIQALNLRLSALTERIEALENQR